VGDLKRESGEWKFEVWVGWFGAKILGKAFSV